MKNIHILPTDKPSRLHSYKGVLNLAAGEFVAPTIVKNDLINLNIYITSDEKIKEGDWVIYLNKPSKIETSVTIEYAKTYCKKIILTTDQDLIKNGVQAIDDEFLEWFVKNPSCEEVEVESNKCLVKRGSCDCSEMDMDCQCLGYKIIIPKEEPKQETIEEAAERIFTPRYTNYKVRRQGFIDGAKWQQERMYSEEDMIKFAEFVATYPDKNRNYKKEMLHAKSKYDGAERTIDLLQIWFEQFKKK